MEPKMPLPSKQNMIYSRLLEMFREDTSGDGRLPSEPELAARIGVARRTLRNTLARLENEGFLIRTNHGTFLREKYRKREIPVTVLVPCPDYQTASGYWSSCLVHQMLLGAVRTAVRAGTYAVTLPVTMNNDPDNLEQCQFRHLNEESMVLLNSADWSPKLLPILLERNCRCAVISERKIADDVCERPGAAICNYYLGDYWECLGDAVRQLVRGGFRRIAYFGRRSTDLSKYGRSSFFNACAELDLEATDDFYALYDSGLYCHHVLSLLRKLYEKIRFDGLIFDNDFFYELPGDLDFFGESGIPRRTGLILSVSELLKHPELPPGTGVLYRPQKETAVKLSEFLLSGKTGVFRTRFKYEFPLLGDFFRRTGA